MSETEIEALQHAVRAILKQLDPQASAGTTAKNILTAKANADSKSVNTHTAGVASQIFNLLK